MKINILHVTVLLILGSILTIAVFFAFFKNYSAESSKPLQLANSETTNAPSPVPTAVSIPITIESTTTIIEAASYTDAILNLIFQYPKITHEVVIDGEKEYGKNNNIILPQIFVDLMGYSPPKVIKAINVREKKDYQGRSEKESPLVALSIWTFENSNNLTIQQWYEQFYYYPFHWGKGSKEIINQQRPSINIDIDGKLGLGWKTVTPRGYVTNVYVSLGNRMMLFEIYGKESTDVGNQIVSTMKFIE